MAEQRQPFRFRLPWLTQPAAPRPTAETQAQAQTPAQPTATIPIQRPAFRPAGIAPVPPPPPQAQAPAPAPARTEPQPPSPSRAAPVQPPPPQAQAPARTEPQQPLLSRAALVLPPPPPQAQAPARTEPQPPSPSHAAAESRVTFQPASPSRAATQSQAASLPPSPSRAAPQSRPASLPQSPSLRASQPPQAASQTAPQPRSPYRLASQPAGQTSLQPSAPPQTSDFSTIRTDLKPLPESEEKPDKTKEVKGIVHTPAQKEPKQMTVTKLGTVASGSKTQTKEQPSVEFQEEQKQLEKQEVRETKETLTGSHEKKFKTSTSTHRMDRNTAGESRQKPSTVSGERPLLKEIREDISKFVQNLGIGHPTLAINEKPVSVITVAGENRGASMQLGSESAKREGSVHIQTKYKINQDESAETTTDAEASSKRRSSKYPMTKEDPATKAYINSNIQSINDSILSNSSITENSPGVHLNLSHNPTEPIKSNSKTQSLETRKAEFNITPAEKLTYEPTVRRRCLRGLFMESSDSDPDNPEKPRRHGCRYVCGEKSKDKDTGVL